MIARHPLNPAPLGAGLLAVALLGACGDAPAPLLHTATGAVMGTHFNLRVVAPLDAASWGEIEGRVVAELGAVDDAMTTYRESEVTRFNQWRSSDPFPLSTPTAEVVSLALELADATDGALDITIAPLVSAFGFGPSGTPNGLPSEAELEALRRRIGYRRLHLDGRLLSKTFPELEIDLSAIAKGYAVDRAAAALAGSGIADFMVEVGGEVRAHGVNERGESWRIGIERPDATGRRPQRIVALADLAMATSGDYRNYREIDGRRLSHLLDPRTGEPIDHRVASATVLDPRCATADGLATAMMVLGEEGLELAAANDWAVLLLVRTEEGFVELESPRFTRLVDSSTAASS